jgi:predicted transcriptional regulator
MRILSGEKEYEFRKRFPRNVETVYMYATSPIKKLVGKFTVGDVIEDEPHGLWKKFKTYAGIDEKEFFEYFKGSRIGYAIQIKDLKVFPPVDPKKIIFKFTPPESYLYTDTLFL